MTSILGHAEVAKRFYHEAIVLDVSRGLPFNQLATLAGTDLNGLSAAFYYLKW